jgi:hypothetical protein
LRLRLLELGVGCAAAAVAGGCSAALSSGSSVETTAPVPHWGAVLEGEQRWLIVMGGAAVLDRETGLVWERLIDTRPEENGGRPPMSWSDAFSRCATRRVGDRWGWRLPEAYELGSLLAPTLAPLPSGRALHLPPGHPFVFAAGSARFTFWSATSNVWTSERYEAGILNLETGELGSSTPAATFDVLCVRGGGLNSSPR